MPEAAPGLAEALGPLAWLSWCCLHPGHARGAAVPGDTHLTEGEIAKLCSDKAFARPLRRVMAPEKAVAAPEITLAELHALSMEPEGRLALALAGASPRTLEREALAFAAAAMQRQILAQVGKSSRLALKSALGADAFRVATQQAPTLYKALASLADAEKFREAMSAGEAAEMRNRFLSFGIGLFYGFVMVVAPKLGPLVASRAPCGGSGFRTWTEPQLSALPQFVKLGNRRLRQWPAIIV